FRSLPVPITQLCLSAVLKCGQSFRWLSYELPPTAGKVAEASLTPVHSTRESVAEVSPTHEYRFCLHDRVICLRQSSSTLYYRALYPPHISSADTIAKDAQTLSWIRDYFQLDVDVEYLYRQWAEKDPVFKRLGVRFSGIRILRQDPWENLISFICSSNNNIARITKMIHNLCKEYSPPLLSVEGPSLGVETYHPFPPPSVLAAQEVKARLRTLGFGYRADYIQRTAEMLVQQTTESGVLSSASPLDVLMQLRQVATTEAREELLKFVGVGRKVADCILLMSLDKKEVIPVDTHVYQIAIKHYGLKLKSTSKSSREKAPMTPKIYDEVSNKLSAVWGEYAGWAHSVLFTSDLRSFA
ncbi:DNA glycosylase, partial [Fistulina hepatica ATCC 64428]